MRYLLLILNFFFCLACKDARKSPDLSKVKVPAEHIDPTPDQVARRQRSEAICRSHGVPIYSNPYALFPDPEDQVTIRDQAAVIDRVMALFYVALKSLGEKKHFLDSLGKAWRIMDKLSPAESTYIRNDHPDQKQTTSFSWKTEDLHVLLWALQFVDTLDFPDHECNVSADGKLFPRLDLSGLPQRARLRSKKEILDQADLILRLDWACVDSRTKNQLAPGGLNSDVVVERHYVLNWLIRYLDQDWDDVTTDT